MNSKLFLLFVVAAGSFYCNTPKKSGSFTPPVIVETIPTPPVDTILLHNLNDSASYAIGISVANYYKQMGVKEINTSLVSKAINDILKGEKALIADNEANTLMNNFLTRLMAEKAKATIEEGEKFLAENKTKPGVITTASGLQYEVLRQGTGQKPSGDDKVSCHYAGTFINGEKVDNSYDRGEPLTFALNGVIAGWTEGIQLMNVGSKYKFYIPYTLGYGTNDNGPIPGGSMLIFEVELLDVKKNK